MTLENSIQRTRTVPEARKYDVAVGDARKPYPDISQTDSHIIDPSAGRRFELLTRNNRYDLELSWDTGAPDGFERQMIHINSQFPGPTLEFEQDKWVEITVHNKMPFNTSIHWHGIEQFNTPEADGVPGFTQRSIYPNESYTYKWRTDQYGAYFYHAHSRGQSDDGCYGALIIRPKAGLAKPFDKVALGEIELLEAAEATSQQVLVADWRHYTSEDTRALELATGLEAAICMDSLLINGKGAVNCWPREKINQYTSAVIAPILERNNLALTDKGWLLTPMESSITDCCRCIPPNMLAVFAPGGLNLSLLPPEVFDICTPTQGSQEIIKAPSEAKWLALDLISAAGTATLAFSIDEHPLWVYAVDGHYIEPLQVDTLSLANGDRYSVFVKLDKPASNYGIRLAATTLNQLIDTTAILSYGSDNTTQKARSDSVGIITSSASINQAGRPLSPNVTVFNQGQMVSFPPQFPQPGPEVDQTFIMSLQAVGNAYTWVLNGTAFNHDFDDLNPPLLYREPEIRGLGQNITIVTKNNTWIDLIFRVVTPNQTPHPLHKHSNKGFIIGQGIGAFRWSSVAEAQAAIPQNFNFKTPPYRDVFTTPPTTLQAPASWLAMRYHVVNPGPFIIHCHISSHLSGGMAMAIFDGVDKWPHGRKQDGSLGGKQNGEKHGEKDEEEDRWFFGGITEDMTKDVVEDMTEDIVESMAKGIANGLVDGLMDGLVDGTSRMAGLVDVRCFNDRARRSGATLMKYRYIELKSIMQAKAEGVNDAMRAARWHIGAGTNPDNQLHNHQNGNSPLLTPASAAIHALSKPQSTFQKPIPRSRPPLRN
ncbi:hypothetical protein CC78DRAFT_584689 [Lojkania enalia]|uniref:Uncharacterized protein n=1 Tax=Lojkania enalia TaxID=147567 RepID=A0A9P4K0X5_9PLEO|nr:hypothetical protein CC78DRAFT_584689 [Didymosphaeria enalia]